MATAGNIALWGKAGMSAKPQNPISVKALKKADLSARRIQQLVDQWHMWEAYPSPYPHLKPDFERKIRKELRALTASINRAVRNHEHRHAR